MPKRLLNLGGTPEMSLLFKKRLKAINTMLLVCASNCFIYGVLLLLFDIRPLSIIVFALSICFFVLLYLQSKKRTGLVRCLFLILLNIFIFFFTVILDKQVEVELLFSILIIIPLFFYEFKDFKKWILFSLLSALFLIASNILPNVSYIPISGDQINILKTIVWITLFLWTGIFFYWTSYEYGKAELDLTKKNKSLKNLLIEFKKNEKELLSLNAQMLEKNKDMSNIIHIVSHDLKEPVQTLITGVTMMQSADLAPEIKAHLEESVEFAKEELNYMYRGIRKYSSVCMFNETEEVDINDVLKEVSESYTDTKKLIVNASKMPIIRAQKSDIVILLDELMSNSIKYNENESVEISFDTISSNDDSFFEIRYTDNSLGFDENDDDVFKMFFRKYNKEVSNKRGVGLALIKKIVTFYGGTIENIACKVGSEYKITLLHINND